MVQIVSLLFLFANILGAVGSDIEGAFVCGNGKHPSQHFVFYDPIVKWGGNVEVHLQFGSQWNSVFYQAIQEWNSQIKDIQIVPVLEGTGMGSEDDGINQMFFASDTYGRPFGGAGATTVYRYSSSLNFAETDIVFNSALDWEVYQGPFNGKPEFKRAALHELGHLLGLTHPDENGQTVQAIMNSTIGNLDRLTADDISGVQQLYGKPIQAGDLTFTFQWTPYGPVFEFTGTPNRSIAVLRSSDLKNWFSVTMVENPSGTVSFLDLFAPPPYRFYIAQYAR